MATISGSSSAKSVPKTSPSTPPQIQIRLEPITATSEPGFNDLYPWQRHHDEQPKLASSPLLPPFSNTSYTTSLHHLGTVRRDSLQPPNEAGVGSSRSMSSADMYSMSQDEPMQSYPVRYPDDAEPIFSPPPLEQYRSPPSSHSIRPSQPELPTEESSGEILDIFEDDKLPGYQVVPRRSPRPSPIAVRIPRQLIGWKAILMDTASDDTPFESDSARKARRASKVLGRQGWEVRQERLKNSYDFRRGSGIWASMHAGARLFKHDWHVIVKDGSRYVWKMDRHALALFREEDGVKVAEYRKAVPLDIEDGGVGLEGEKRIGSFKFEAQRSRIRVGHSQDGTIFGMNLALASLVAVFGARGGHGNVSAAFEPSSNPMREVLEQRRQEVPDREEVMLALPRPGFARDSESLLSDTTDEDAGESPSGAGSHRRSVAHVHSQQGMSYASRSADLRDRPMKPEEQRKAGRKRFSSLFGRGNSSPAGPIDEDRHSPEDKSMTASQHIARQYRTQGVFSSN